MSKTHPHIPKAAREAALKAFNHLCAACGEVRPQIHHIDHNPKNNDPLNLLPLCPNEHLRDAHDPTQPIEPDRLRLLRVYRDPTVLDPKFQPIFLRLQAFRTSLFRLCSAYSPKEPSVQGGMKIKVTRLPSHEIIRETFEKADELWRFLREFEKGAFYARELERLIAPEAKAGVIASGYLDFTMTLHTLHLRDLVGLFASIEAMLVEMLRYQDWKKAARTR